MLKTVIFDAPSDVPTAPTCLIVHGLFGSGRNWGAIAKRMSQKRRIITVDMRNHGDSPHTQTHSYEDLAADLAEVINAQGGPMDVIGHSMGGKSSMMLALTRPEALNSLIVADIAPVPYSHTQTQFIDAMRAVDLKKVTRRSDASEQLAAQGVEPALQSFFTQSLDVTSKRWSYNLDTLEAEMPKILSFPDVHGQFTKPTLFLTGGDSDYVLPEHRPRIKELFPHARFAKLPNAGHWLHAERPKAFIAAAETFLEHTG